MFKNSFDVFWQNQKRGVLPKFENGDAVQNNGVNNHSNGKQNSNGVSKEKSSPRFEKIPIDGDKDKGKVKKSKNPFKRMLGIPSSKQ